MKNKWKNKRGIAIFEFAFLLFILLFAIVLIFGSWGVTRSAILHSIAARTYLWDEVNQRDNTLFLRDRTLNNADLSFIAEQIYWSLGSRFYTVVKDIDSREFIPPKRKIDIGGADWSDVSSGGWLGLNSSENKEDLYDLSSSSNELKIKSRNLQQGSFERNKNYKTSVVFLRMGYGICIDNTCEAH